MTQSCNFIRAIAISTGAFVEGVTLFCTGGRYHRFHIVVSRNKFVSLNLYLFAGPKTVGVIGKVQYIVLGTSTVKRRRQIPTLCPVKAPTGAIKVADGIPAYRSSRHFVGEGHDILAFVAELFAVEGCQQILPVFIAIGVGVGIII